MPNGPTACDVTEARLLLQDEFTDDELRQIRLVPEGTRLDEGAVYVDLRDPAREEIRAAAEMAAGEAHLLVAKTDVDEPTWNRLLKRVPAGQTGG
jgi:hypothetical protein